MPLPPSDREQLALFLKAFDSSKASETEIHMGPGIIKPAPHDIEINDLQGAVWEPMRRALTRVVYSHLYARRWTPESLLDPALAEGSEDQSIPSRVAPDYYHSPGWHIESAGDVNRIIARRMGVKRRLFSGEFITDLGPTRPLRPDDTVTIIWPHSLRFSEHTTMDFGAVPFYSEDPEDEIRFYINAKTQNCPTVYETILQLLKKLSVPFRAKIMLSPSERNRRDRIVLYLHRRIVRFVLAELLPVIKNMRHDLIDDRPLFTARLETGISWAESPPAPYSFGEIRSRQIARSLCEAFKTKQPLRLQSIEINMEEKEVDLASPHLISNRSRAAFHPGLKLKAADHNNTIVDTPFTQAALNIGTKLINEAFFYEDKATWLSPKIIDGRAQYRADDVSFYEGSAGIALAFASLFKLTQKSYFSQMSILALNHAQANLLNLSPPNAMSVYSGELGVHFAAYHCALCLEDQTTRIASLKALAQCLNRRAAAELRANDIYEGDASGLLVLTQIAKTDAEFRAQCEDDIRALAHELIDKAESKDGILSWSSMAHKGGPDLLGYAHGAAGIALALESAAVLLEDSTLHEACLKALDYEKSQFDLKRGGWPDHRSEDLIHLGGWCHGVPGGLLARHLIRQVTQDNVLKDQLASEIQDALPLMKQALQRDKDNTLSDATLCHGMMGRRLIAHILSKDASFDKHMWLKKIDLNIHLNSYSLMADWPSGVLQETTSPGLMTGSSGIAMAFILLDNHCAVNPICLFM